MPEFPFSSIQQIPLGKMERGLARPIATLKLEPSEITRRLGVEFETTRDDLDELDAAVICSGTGRQFALVRHRHQPGPGTDILTNERSPDLSADLRDALHVLQFDPKELRWMHPGIEVKELQQVFHTGKHSEQPLPRKIQPPYQSSSLVKATEEGEPLQLKVSRGARIANRSHNLRIFIGSAGNSLRIARKIKAALNPKFTAEVWDTRKAFISGQTINEGLESAAQNFDFAVLVLGGEDVVVSRGKGSWLPRDNVTFDYGQFAGIFGRHRVLGVVLKGVDVNVSGDLLGVTIARYDPPKRNIASVCADIQQAILDEREKARWRTKT
jgi:predicted nucleotide-binding protein